MHVHISKAARKVSGLLSFFSVCMVHLLRKYLPRIENI